MKLFQFNQCYRVLVLGRKLHQILFGK